MLLFDLCHCVSKINDDDDDFETGTNRNARRMQCCSDVRYSLLRLEKVGNMRFSLFIHPIFSPWLQVCRKNSPPCDLSIWQRNRGAEGWLPPLANNWGNSTKCPPLLAYCVKPCVTLARVHVGLFLYRPYRAEGAYNSGKPGKRGNLREFVNSGKLREFKLYSGNL